ASPPAAAMRASVSSSVPGIGCGCAAVERAAHATRAPACASASAVAAPTPRLAPVTRATFPERSMPRFSQRARLARKRASGSGATPWRAAGRSLLLGLGRGVRRRSAGVGDRREHVAQQPLRNLARRLVHLVHRGPHGLLEERV